MTDGSESRGFFHWLIKRGLCCHKCVVTERSNPKNGLPEDEDYRKVNPGKHLMEECQDDTNCKTLDRNEEQLKGKAGAADGGSNVLHDVDSLIREDMREGSQKSVEAAEDLKGFDQKLMTGNNEMELRVQNSEKKSLMNHLEHLECPFVWKPDRDGAVFKDGCWIYSDNERNGALLVEYLTAKESEFRLVQNNFFRTICIYLVLAYEKALLGQMASSVADIYHCQMLVSKAESDINCTEGFLFQKGRKDGVYYVLLASIAHLKFLQGSYSSSQDTIHSIKENFSSMSPEARAIIHGLHTGVLMEYGYRGNRMAVGPVRAALALDPDCWLWSLYLGKMLGRYRRKTQFHMPAGREELLALQRAAQLHPEAECLSHLADVYKHLNSLIMHQGYIPRHISEIFTAEEIESLPQLARDLYVKAASKEPNCPYNNARCAKGLLSLPTPFKDMGLAEKCMVKALHLAPNDSLVNHYAAYYHETRKEFDQALDSYHKALVQSGGSMSAVQEGVGNFPAELGFLALHHRLQTGQQEWVGSSTQVGGGGVRGGRYSISRGAGAIGCVSHYSPLFHLDAMLSIYKSTPHRVQTLCNKGYYLLTVEKDVHGALRTFAKAIRMDPGSITLKKFWSVFNSGDTSQPCAPLNVYHLVKEEIKRVLSLPLTGNHSYIEGLLDLVHQHDNGDSCQ